MTDNERSLFWAIGDNNLEGVKKLINEGIDINVKDKAGGTPLLKAVRYDYIDIVKFLIEKGANVNTISNRYETALMWAIDNKNKEMITLLKDVGAKGCVIPIEEIME